jgi:hypothetical protein
MRKDFATEEPIANHSRNRRQHHKFKELLINAPGSCVN